MVHSLQYYETSKIMPLEELVDSRVKTLDELVEIKKAREGEVMVFASGCFDLVHADHIDYLAWARTLGDYLLVAINDDYSIEQLKGVDRPINELEDRMKLLSVIQYVDYLTSFSELNTVHIIDTLQPGIFARGKDLVLEGVPNNGRKPMNQRERKAVGSYGGKILFLDKLPRNSTTRIIGKIQNDNWKDY